MHILQEHIGHCDCYEYLYKHNSGTRVQWMTELITMTIFVTFML